MSGNSTSPRRNRATDLRTMKVATTGVAAFLFDEAAAARDLFLADVLTTTDVCVTFPQTERNHAPRFVARGCRRVVVFYEVLRDPWVPVRKEAHLVTTRRGSRQRALPHSLTPRPPFLETPQLSQNGSVGTFSLSISHPSKRFQWRWPLVNNL